MTMVQLAHMEDKCEMGCFQGKQATNHLVNANSVCLYWYLLMREDGQILKM